MSDINPIEDHPAGQSTLGLQLYLVRMLAITPFDDPIKSYMGDHRQAFDAHLEWLRQIEADGTMFASGVLKDENNWDGSGMAIIRANSFDEAVAIAEAEPFHAAGVRKNEVHGWVLNEANFQISLKLMNQEILVG
ncbi:MAG: YciI family protein [Rhodospirillales bacterium]|nr:YciI family protein [Rhodospirillales bacterium]